MHLFGGSDEPHLTHFLADRQSGSVVLAWDVRNAPALSWRVLRSEHDFAKTADALVGSDQTLLSDSQQCGVRDEKADARTTYYYTVFARGDQGVWHRQVKVKIKPEERLGWHHPADAVKVEGDRVDCGELEPESDPVVLMVRNFPIRRPPLFL